MIPLIDLKAQLQQIESHAKNAVLGVLCSTQYILGTEVKAFEEEMKAYLGVEYAIGVANGTDALIIALKALGIKEGDEVIVPAFSFFASAEAIAFIGAVPVFCDVKEDTYNIDPSLIEEKITEKTKAIMVVHLFGQPVEMDPISDIAKRHDLLIIEDAAQAIGASYKGAMVGSLGDIACFSFFPTKNLGGAGDGGMITTSVKGYATKVAALRAHGSGDKGYEAYSNEETGAESLDETVYNAKKYYNYLVGHNSRLDEIQAALLRVKLKHLDAWNETRIKTAQAYREAFKDLPLRVSECLVQGKHVYHMLIMVSEEREALTSYLKDEGIATGIYYPVPLHLQVAFKELGYQPGDFPVSEWLSERTFAIAVYPELTKEQQDYIIEKVQAYYEGL